jgi:hypothetical protein
MHVQDLEFHLDPALTPSATWAPPVSMSRALPSGPLARFWEPVGRVVGVASKLRDEPLDRGELPPNSASASSIRATRASSLSPLATSRRGSCLAPARPSRSAANPVRAISE